VNGINASGWEEGDTNVAWCPEAADGQVIVPPGAASEPTTTGGIMTREERAAYVATAKRWLSLVRSTSYRELYVTLWTKLWLWPERSWALFSGWQPAMLCWNDDRGAPDHPCDEVGKWPRWNWSTTPSARRRLPAGATSGGWSGLYAIRVANRNARVQAPSPTGVDDPNIWWCRKRQDVIA